MDIVKSKNKMVAWCLRALVVIATLGLSAGQEPHKIKWAISEELPRGTRIGSIQREAALNNKYPRNILRTFEYDILKGRWRHLFYVTGSDGFLHTNGTIDRDEICPQEVVCELLLDVAVIKPIEYFQIIKVTIELLDLNDNSPTFPRENIVLEISENALPGMSFVIPSASDLDSGTFGVQRYEFVSSGPRFRLDDDDNDDLRIVLTQRLDREIDDHYNMKVIAIDGGEPPKTGSVDIEVRVQDSNDNSPVFDFPVYNVTVKESASVGDVIVTVHANDIDKDANGLVHYGFSSTTATQHGDTFYIDLRTGEITLKRQLDYESVTEYALIVTATDQGPDAIAAHAKVLVFVVDVNDHRPVITLNTLTETGQAQISEWAEVGAFVGHLSVEDLDKGPSGQVTCSIRDANFELQKLYTSEYKIVTAGKFDYERRAAYTLSVTCVDGGNPPLTTSQDITVKILDQNDNTPVFDKKVYVASIRENNTEHTPVAVVTATDLDTGLNGEVVYSLHENAGHRVKIVPTTGVITTNSVFDHEREKTFTFHVIAADRGTPSLMATATVTLSILDINDEAPTFKEDAYTFGSFENQPVYTEIGTVEATDNDSAPFDTFTFSIDPRTLDGIDTFDIEPNTGKIRTKKVLDREHQGVFYFTIIARNVAYPRLSSSASVTVFVADRNDNAPQITYPTPENNTIQLASNAPLGYVFTKVRAIDADQGTNSKLTFNIAKGNSADMFALDTLSGALSVNRDLRYDPGDVYTLLIMVRDSGDPPKSAVTTVNVVVNRTISYGDLGPNSSAHSVFPFLLNLGFHQKIIILLGCVTAVLVAILVTAIVCIRRKQSKADKESYRYMCRVDLANRLSGLAEGDGSHVSYKENIDSPDSTLERPFGERDGQQDREKRGGGGQSPIHSDDSRTHLTLDDLSRMREPAVAPGGGSVPHDNASATLKLRSLPRATPPPRPGYTLPANLQGEKEVEVHQLLQLLKRDGDSDSTSGCSADTNHLSNTDSGKGGSEEYSTEPPSRGHPAGGRRVLPPPPKYQPTQPKYTSAPAPADGKTLTNGRHNNNKPRSPPITYMLGRDPKTGRLSPLPPSTTSVTAPHSGGGSDAHGQDTGGGGGNCNPATVTGGERGTGRKPVGGSHGHEAVVPHLRTFSPITVSGGYQPTTVGKPLGGYQAAVKVANANNSSNRNSSVCSDDGGSTTSGSYVVDLDHSLEIPHVKAVDV